MTLEELIRLDDKTILFGIDTQGNRYLPQMLRLYQEKFGVACSSCPKKYPEYLRKLKNFSMKKEDKQFQLAKAVTIPIFGTSEVYSDENITDEAALKILSRNPKAIKLFKKFPEKWEELVEGYKLGETEIRSIDELANLKVDVIRALFPDAKGRSREDLIADIAERYPELTGQQTESDPETENDTKETD